MLTDDKTKRARSSNSFVSVIISGLERKNLFQTFTPQSAAEIEQEIMEIRILLSERDDLNKTNDL